MSFNGLRSSEALLAQGLQGPCEEEHPGVQVQMALLFVDVEAPWIVIQATGQAMRRRAAHPSIAAAAAPLAALQEGEPSGKPRQRSGSKGDDHLPSLLLCKSQHVCIR